MAKKRTTAKNKTKKKLLNFKTRVFIDTFVFVVSLITAIFIIGMSFSIIKEQNINYQENSNIDYKVFLKKNDFYEQEYLGKDKVYVASLIKSIEANFNYIFKIDTKTDIDFIYDITGTLVIADSGGKKTFFEKDYQLLKEERAKITKGTVYNLNKTVDIDYDYYNNLANKFKTNYGINSTSNLIVKLNIKEINKDDAFKLNNTSTMLITIPLSEREVNISMNYNEVNRNNEVLQNGGISVSNYFLLASGILFLILSILVLIKLIRELLSLRKPLSKYEKYLKRILREYDRLIVNTPTAPDKKGKKVTTINSFDELLDVRDNLKLPIKYYINEEHEKCSLYINHEDELYLLILEAKEMEKTEKNT